MTSIGPIYTVQPRSLAAFAALSYMPSVGPHNLITEVQAAALTPVIGVGSMSILVVWLCALALCHRPVYWSQSVIGI